MWEKKQTRDFLLQNKCVTLTETVSKFFSKMINKSVWCTHVYIKYTRPGAVIS